MEFKTTYYNPMDRDYGPTVPDEVSPPSNLEDPILPISQIGQTVPEGNRFGSFLQTAKGAIWAGAGTLELATGMGGGMEPVGAESYGQEAREAIREMAKANEVKVVSIHSPTNIGNMSGFNPQQGNFSDEYRKVETEEVKNAIRFAAEAAQGGAVVIHTGEYHRPIFDAEWNQQGKWAGKFKGYDEEPDRAVKPLVDTRTGRLIQEVRMNQKVAQAVWNRYEEGNELWDQNKGGVYIDENGVEVKPGDYVDYEGRKVHRSSRVPKYDPEKKTFVITTKTWADFVRDADEMNQEKAADKNMDLQQFKQQHPDEWVYPEEAFMYATTETQEKISLGWAGNYAKSLEEDFKALKELKKAKEYYKKIEEKIPEEERWRIKVDDKTYARYAGAKGAEFLPAEKKTPVQLIDEALYEVRKSIEQHKDMVSGQLQSAREQRILRDHTKSAHKYAFNKSMESYVDAGIYAMQESMNNPYVQRDVFLAPENIFPEMGFGSHPEELIKLVKTARKRMKDKLMDPNGQWKMSEYDADQRAERHIKATLDTQHLGMWIKHFKREPGESEEARIKRFNSWYMDMIKRMADENIVGYVHLVDGYGGGHQHLPAGQGIFPVVEAMKEMRRRGFRGYINSEGHGEERHGKGRILVEAWKAFGAPITLGRYGVGAPPQRTWTDVHQSYFGQNYPPKFIFGAYSPSNDWTLWSQVPME